MSRRGRPSRSRSCSGRRTGRPRSGWWGRSGPVGQPCRPGGSCPACPSSRVVRSIILMARSSAHSFDSRLMLRLASIAARSSMPTRSTGQTRPSRLPSACRGADSAARRRVAGLVEAGSGHTFRRFRTRRAMPAIAQIDEVQDAPVERVAHRMRALVTTETTLTDAATAAGQHPSGSPNHGSR